MSAPVIPYRAGIPEEHRQTAARLHDQAFGSKFRVAVPDERKRLEILARGLMDGIAVSPQMRGHGIGTGLLEAVCQEARSLGCRERAAKNAPSVRNRSGRSGSVTARGRATGTSSGIALVPVHVQPAPGAQPCATNPTRRSFSFLASWPR
jgi:GNAT superfamily N-acetyltransferase